MLSGSAQRKRRREVLWKKQQGHCHWCGCQMLHWDDLKRDPSKQQKYDVKAPGKIKKMPRDLATIDHLRDRYHAGRQEPNLGKEQRWVLACWQCNNERGTKSTKQQLLKDLWKRSGRAKEMSVVKE